MKKILTPILLCNYLFGVNCSDLLKEGDTYLEKSKKSISLSASSEYSNLASAYYKRFEICVYYYENNSENYRVPEAKEFIKGTKSE